MKKYSTIYSTVILIVFCVVFAQCKKQSNAVNIILYDKDTTTINKYILGKWRVHYQYGGFCGMCKFDLDSNNEYYEFGSNNSIKFFTKDTVNANMRYYWFANQITFNTYTMHCYYGSFDPVLTMQPYAIQNDTLILAIPFWGSPDYSQFFLTKSN